LLSIINFCSKPRTKPKPSSRIRTEIFENNSFWGKKKVWSWGFNQQFTISDQVTSNWNQNQVGFPEPEPELLFFQEPDQNWTQGSIFVWEPEPCLFKEPEPEVFHKSAEHWSKQRPSNGWGVSLKQRAQHWVNIPCFFCCWQNSLPNFDVKKMSLTYAKEFSWKK
jgi:hypothetical protein